MSDPLTNLTPPVGADEAEISLLDVLQVVVENLRLLVLGPIAVGLVALGITFLITPTFTATTKFLPPQQQQSAAAAMLQQLGALGGLAGAATGIKNPNDQFVAFLQSRTIQDTLVDRFNLVERYEVELKANARKELDNNVNIVSGKDGLITIDATDADKIFAAKLANAYIEELSNLLGKLAITEAQQRRAFFEKQLNDAKGKLINAELALQASGISSNVLKTDPTAAVEGLARLKASIAAQEIKLASMRGYLAESAPDFKQAQTELAAMRSQLVRAEAADPKRTGIESDYVTKFRDFKYYETLFELFAKQYEMAKIDESREGAVIQVLDIAIPPELKSKPKKAQIAILSTLATGLFLLLYVFVKHALISVSAAPETAAKFSKLRTGWQRAIGRSKPYKN